MVKPIRGRLRGGQTCAIREKGQVSLYLQTFFGHCNIPDKHTASKEERRSSSTEKRIDKEKMLP